jgi:hypothetical protein
MKIARIQLGILRVPLKTPFKTALRTVNAVEDVVVVVTTDITISVDYIDKMVADSVAAVERGFAAL